jgi:hypothetical protein
MSVSYAERGEFDPLARYDFEVWSSLAKTLASGARNRWFESTHLDEKWRAAHLGVRSALQADRAEFNPLALYETSR